MRLLLPVEDLGNAMAAVGSCLRMRVLCGVKELIERKVKRIYVRVRAIVGQLSGSVDRGPGPYVCRTYVGAVTCLTIDNKGLGRDDCEGEKGVRRQELSTSSRIFDRYSEIAVVVCRGFFVQIVAELDVGCT